MLQRLGLAGVMAIAMASSTIVRRLVGEQNSRVAQTKDLKREN
jgi:hypothetical protein